MRATLVLVLVWCGLHCCEGNISELIEAHAGRKDRMVFFEPKPAPYVPHLLQWRAGHRVVAQDNDLELKNSLGENFQTSSTPVPTTDMGKTEPGIPATTVEPGMTAAMAPTVSTVTTMAPSTATTPTDSSEAGKSELRVLALGLREDDVTSPSLDEASAEPGTAVTEEPTATAEHSDIPSTETEVPTASPETATIPSTVISELVTTAPATTATATTKRRRRRKKTTTPAPVTQTATMNPEVASLQAETQPTLLETAQYVQANTTDTMVTPAPVTQTATMNPGVASLQVDTQPTLLETAQYVQANTTDTMVKSIAPETATIPASVVLSPQTAAATKRRRRRKQQPTPAPGATNPQQRGTGVNLETVAKHTEAAVATLETTLTTRSLEAGTSSMGDNNIDIPPTTTSTTLAAPPADTTTRRRRRRKQKTTPAPDTTSPEVRTLNSLTDATHPRTDLETIQTSLSSETAANKAASQHAPETSTTDTSPGKVTDLMATGTDDPGVETTTGPVRMPVTVLPTTLQGGAPAGNTVVTERSESYLGPEVTRPDKRTKQGVSGGRSFRTWPQQPQVTPEGSFPGSAHGQRRPLPRWMLRQIMLRRRLRANSQLSEHVSNYQEEEQGTRSFVNQDSLKTGDAGFKNMAHNISNVQAEGILVSVTDPMVNKLDEKNGNILGNNLMKYYNGSVIPTDTRLSAGRNNQNRSPSKAKFNNFVQNNQFTCPQDEGDFAIEVVGTRFTRCKLGLPEIHPCTAGEIFDILNRRCGPKSTFAATFKCPSAATSNHSIPGYCTGYINCYASIAEIKYCDGGRHWSPSLGACVDAVRAGCALQCPTTWGTYPYLHDCSYYVSCGDGQPTVHSCPPNMLFDHGRVRCEPEDRASCQNQFRCPGIPGLYPVLHACNKYYDCGHLPGENQNNLATIQTCPEGHIFDYMSNSCTTHDSNNCVQDCPEHDGSFSIPGHSNVVKLCIAGTATYHSCGGGVESTPMDKQCMLMSSCKIANTPRLFQNAK